MSKRILIIGMADSVHLSRWLTQFSESDLIFEIVSSSPHRRVHSGIQRLVDERTSFRLGAATRYFSLPFWFADRFTSDFFRGLLIALVARRFRPHVVHIFESQNGGYAFLRARSFSKYLADCQIILTPYGSDFFWYKDYPKHRKKLEKLLSVVAFLSSESERDEKLALSLGYRGRFLPRIPAAGGLSLPPVVPGIHDRKFIAIKGYENRWGVASNALLALRPLVEDLRGYEVVLFSCNRKIIPVAKKFREDSGLRVQTFGKGKLSHDQVQSILSNSVLLLSLSRSDGLPASMLEAMANGAVPIQSSTSCCNEWIEDGKGGFVVKFDDIPAITEAVRKTIADDNFRQAVLESNRKLLLERLNPDHLFGLAVSTYDRIP